MATAPPITSKSEQANRLRTESAALTKELAQAKEKLEISQHALAALQDKRRKLTEDVARGQQLKTGVIAALHAEIAEAQIPSEGLTALVNEKQARLDQVRSTLQTLESELAHEAQQAARQSRFASLRAQGGEVSARIAEKLRGLIEDDLPALDQVRDSLTSEFVNTGRLNAQMIDPEVTAARQFIRHLEGHFFDGSFLRAERALLRQGWTVRGDIELRIKNLKPPRQ
jgi:chromosome segregation ATPase